MVTRQSRGQDDLAAEPRSIDLRDYALVVRRRWVLVLVLAVLGAALGFAYHKHEGTSYAATAQVVVEPITQGPLNPPAQPNLQVNMSTEQSVAQSAPVALLAARLLHSPLSGAQAQAALSKHLTVTVPVLSDVLQLTWLAGTPQAAQLGANAFANAYLTYRHDSLASTITRLGAALRQEIASLQRQIKKAAAHLGGVPGSAQRQADETTLTQLNGRLTTANDTLASLRTYDDSGGSVIAAARPLSPAGLGKSLLIALGGLLGLLIGVIVAFVRDAFDDRVRDAAGMESKLGAPALAVLPRPGRRPMSGSGRDGARARGGDAVLTVTRPTSPAADAVRTLRATVAALSASQDLRTVVVVGADSSVSSSHVAAELGIALAESGRSTLVMATDLRGSWLPQIFDLPNITGLTNLLGGDASEALTQYPKHADGVALPPRVAKRLAVIANGPPLAQPMSVLDSQLMVSLMTSCRNAYDYVVLDSPAVDEAADFLALAGLVDGVLVLVSQGRTRGRALEQLRHRIDQVGGHLMGGVLVARRRVAGDLRQRPERGGSRAASIPPATSAVERPAGGRESRDLPGTRSGRSPQPGRTDSKAGGSPHLTNRPS